MRKVQTMTDAQVAAIVRKGKPGKTAVAPSTYIMISNQGQPYWVYAYCRKGVTHAEGEPQRQRTMSLGRWEPYHRVADFSRRVQAMQALLEAGIDPKTWRDSQAAQAREVAA